VGTDGDFNGPLALSGKDVKAEVICWFQQQSGKSHAAVKQWLVCQCDACLRGHDEYF